MITICKDLSDEYEELDSLIQDLNEIQWCKIVSFGDWNIKDEISHLAYFDRAAFLSVTDLDAFRQNVEAMLEGFVDYDQMHQKINGEGSTMPAAELLFWWRSERNRLLDAFQNIDAQTKLPWYGPPMKARSFASARLMETWAHGQDIVDALRVDRKPTDRLKHIAHIGVSTFAWSFQNRKLPIPEDPVYVELALPSGTIWSKGPSDADNYVKGTALDFCLVATRRRHPDDTELTVYGDVALKWMEVIQAFAGPPEKGPEPGERIYR